MKLKKDLAMLVKTDFVPLQADKEGSLRGGFGTMITGASNSILGFNAYCSNKNPTCTNDGCKNPSCANQCTINYCSTSSPTTAPSPSTSPSPTTASAVSAFILGF